MDKLRIILMISFIFLLLEILQKDGEICENYHNNTTTKTTFPINWKTDEARGIKEKTLSLVGEAMLEEHLLCIFTIMHATKATLCKT